MDFLPSQNSMPKLSSEDVSKHASNETTNTLLNPKPEAMFVALDATQKVALQ